MPRPTKPVAELSATTRISNSEREFRERAEAALMGPCDALAPPDGWTPERRAIYSGLIECFPPMSLCNMDAPLLQELAVSLDRKAKLDARADADAFKLMDKDWRAARKDCLAAMTKCMDSLGMSRTARARAADHAASAAKKAASVWDAAG